MTLKLVLKEQLFILGFLNLEFLAQVPVLI